MVCVCVCVGYSPKPELIYTEIRVKEYILWLQAYYLPGSTTRNKCWHLKNYVAFLRLVKDDATQEQVRHMIICKKLFNKAANESKQVARTDRVLLEDEYHMTNVKSMSTHQFSFFFISSHFFHSYSIPNRCKLYIFLFVSSSCMRCMFCDVCAMRCKRDCPQTRWIIISNFRSFLMPLWLFATKDTQTIYLLVRLLELNKSAI